MAEDRGMKVNSLLGTKVTLGDNGNFLCFVWTNSFMICLQFYSTNFLFTCIFFQFGKKSLLQKLIVQENYLTLKNGKKYYALSEKEPYKNITFLLQYFKKNKRNVWHFTSIKTLWKIQPVVVNQTQIPSIYLLVSEHGG